MVDAALVATYAIGLPLLGTFAAVASVMLSWRSATEGMDRATRTERRVGPRLLVFLQIAATLLLFGVAAMILVVARSGGRPDAQLEWAALSVGVPGLLAGLAYAIVFYRGYAHAIHTPTDFGRVVVIAVLPETAVLFGFSIATLILGQASDPTTAAAVAEASRVAALYMIAGSLVAPFEAYSMVAYWRFESRERWGRAIVIGVGLELFLLVAFALAFLALQAV